MTAKKPLALAVARYTILEKAVVAMACDDNLLPLEQRISTVADEVELDDVYATERQLLYVACTRARDRLLITGIAPGSEFLRDL